MKPVSAIVEKTVIPERVCANSPRPGRAVGCRIILVTAVSVRLRVVGESRVQQLCPASDAQDKTVPSVGRAVAIPGFECAEIESQSQRYVRREVAQRKTNRLVHPRVVV